jgi:hypothetical protein
MLKWHNHGDGICHGYISVDPKNTNTRFEEYSIKNEIGRLYIGPSYKFHEVVINEPFDTPRITIAFGVMDCVLDNKINSPPIIKSLSLIPIP